MVDQSVTLPDALQRVIDHIPAQAQPESFRKVFTTATIALNALGAINLGRYEHEEFDISDGSLWETLAPTMRDTLNTVNQLLELIRNEFPLVVRDNELQVETAFDDMFERTEPSASTTTTRYPWREMSETTNPQMKFIEVTKVLRGISGGLAKEITAFGEGIRKPSIVADRWYLLDHVAEFRGKFRTGICEMIFHAAHAFADVDKEDVVPAFRDDLGNSALLRRMLTIMRRRCRIFHTRMASSQDRSVQRRWALSIIQEMEVFVRSPAYPHFRASDKRSFIAQRAELTDILAKDDFSSTQLIRSADGLARFLDSLTTINHRELLLLHDQEAMSHSEMLLAAANTALMGDDVKRGRDHLYEAFRRCEAIFGYDEVFDNIIRVLSKVDLALMDVDDCLAATAMLQRQLSLMIRR
ncbi:MAG: hypothetical protein R3C68_05390 [Myxococcota bacterium]